MYIYISTHMHIYISCVNVYTLRKRNITKSYWLIPKQLIVPLRSRHFLSQKLWHFLKNTRSCVENECCCPCTVNISNVNFTSNIYIYIYILCEYVHLAQTKYYEILSNHSETAYSTTRKIAKSIYWIQITAFNITKQIPITFEQGCKCVCARGGYVSVHIGLMNICK